MKLYVDELPKDCDDCELGYFYDCQYCSLRPDLAREDIWVEKEKHCPLLSIKSLKQQVREEVVEEFKEKIKNIKENIWSHYGKHELINDVDYGKICELNKLLRILDQVKGESNVLF